MGKDRSIKKELTNLIQLGQEKTLQFLNILNKMERRDRKKEDEGRQPQEGAGAGAAKPGPNPTSAKQPKLQQRSTISTTSFLIKQNSIYRRF